MDFTLPCNNKDDGYLNFGIGYWPKTGFYQTLLIGLYSHGPAYHIDYQSDLHMNYGLEIGYRFKHYMAGLSFTNMSGLGIKLGILLPNNIHN